jgi:3-methyladenine DNA glycosylase/8-oxoguanine DNA glycosylase
MSGVVCLARHQPFDWAGALTFMRAVQSPASRRSRLAPIELMERAENWRPWRAYAAHLLWAADAGSRRAVRP